MDDYGTNYSNLVYVLEYPVDVIKLDKSIVWAAFTDQDSFVTIKNLISMFHDGRRKLVAEGVENEEQMSTLRELGCDFIFMQVPKWRVQETKTSFLYFFCASGNTVFEV